MFLLFILPLVLPLGIAAFAQGIFGDFREISVKFPAKAVFLLRIGVVWARVFLKNKKFVHIKP